MESREEKTKLAECEMYTVACIVGQLNKLSDEQKQGYANWLLWYANRVQSNPKDESLSFG